MRAITFEQMNAIQRSETYRLIIDRPKPDHSLLRKEAERFAKWIARQHDKERTAAKASEQ